MKSIFFLSILISFLACSGNKQTSPPAAAIRQSDDTLTPPTGIPDPPQSPTAPASTGKANKWIYQNATSAVYKASLLSPTALTFGFPYKGISTATLTLRHKNNETHVYLEISQGQFNRSFQGGTARIRFGNKPAVSYSFSAAENGRANIIFFDDVQTLISQMKAARTMVVEVGFENQGTRQIAFSTAGLNWSH